MRDKKLATVIFGQVLQELRLGQALTQDKLAELANTERSHISALERAEKGPALAACRAQHFRIPHFEFA
jgi:transcriptional regulator with XRE-family HTH domain